ncbi:MAG TPA: hypothetical protein VFC56_15355 [Stellaceae bacterium]|nr:hypothetical protein [Stellaceae bacterium]
MRRGLERRLARVAAIVGRWKAERDSEDDLLSARRAVAEAIRAGLANAGIDPDEASALRRFAEPDPAPRPETARRPAGLSGAVGILYDKLSALAQRCREHPPDLATASPAMLFAMCCFGDGPAGAAT